jgi:RNA-binding protein YhbY
MKMDGTVGLGGVASGICEKIHKRLENATILKIKTRA